MVAQVETDLEDLSPVLPYSFYALKILKTWSEEQDGAKALTARTLRSSQRKQWRSNSGILLSEYDGKTHSVYIFSPSLNSESHDSCQIILER